MGTPSESYFEITSKSSLKKIKLGFSITL